MAVALLTLPPLVLGQATVQLRNTAAGDGSLHIAPDAYGHWSNFSWFEPNVDLYDPPGAVGPSNVSFAAHMMIYDPVNQDRVCLATDGSPTSNAYNLSAGNNRTLEYRVTSALVASDTTGNGLDDTANSSFWVFGTTGSGDPSLRLTFDLEQKVTGPDPNGVATYIKTYTITNDGENAVSIQFEQHDDFDLGWDGDFRDPVGTASADGFRNAYMQEPDSFPGNASTQVALSGSGCNIYSAGRSNNPAAGPPDPPYRFGTDVRDHWNNYGLHPTWWNHTAYLGYDVDGIDLSLMPADGLSPFDGQMNLVWELELQPGQTTDVVVVHTYGASTPLEPGRPAPGGTSCCDPCDMNCDGNINAFDIEPFLDLLFGPGPPCAPCPGDVNGDGTIDAFDIEPFLECLFP